MRTVEALTLTRSLLDCLPDIAWLATPDGKVEAVNRVCTDYVGVPSDHLLGDEWASVLHPDEREDILDQWNDARANDTQFRSEYRLRGGDGTYRWFLTRASALQDEQGVIRWIGIATDIEDLKRVERALASARRQQDELITLMNTIQTAAPVGFAFISPRFRYIRINDSLASMNGIPAADHIGRTIEDIVPEIWPRVEPMFRRILETGEPVTNLEIEGETPAKPGDKRYWLANYYPVRLNGEIIGIGTLTVEITEQRKLEEQLRHAQKMDAVGRLAGSVAHDFNNLLTTIIGNAEVAMGDLPAENAVQAALRDIYEAGKAAAEITSQLLTFSRRQVLSGAVLDPGQALNGFDRLIRQAAGEKVKVVMAVAADAASVRIDRGRFQQVVLNLVVNARDAMPNGGQLTLECRNSVVIDAPAHPGEGPNPGNYVLVSVTDTGTGIPPDVRAKLFEPFFTTKPHGRGTGLGLSTVYGIVTQAGGHISVYSEVNRGSSFKVYLPAEAQPVTQEDAARATPDSLRGDETVLLVEDDDPVRRMTRDVLRRSGYTVLEAENADEALMLHKRFAGDIDLLLCDVALPQYDGRDLAEQIKSQRSGIRVLYMSGYTAAAVGRHERLVPGKNFLGKPFGPTGLLIALRNALTA